MYTMKKLISQDKLGTNIQAVDTLLNVNATESTALTVVGKLTVDANIGAGNPVSVKVYHSYDAGDNWELVTPTDAVNVQANGTFIWRKAVGTVLIGPTVRINISCAALGSFILTDLRYSSMDTADSISFPATIAGGITASTSFELDGVDSGVIEDTIVPANNRSLPVRLFDNEGTQIAVKGSLGVVNNFPLGANAVTMEYPDTVTEVIKYRTGGVAGIVVQTLTMVYSDATKDQLVSVLKS